jgi:hypothetical protein
MTSIFMNSATEIQISSGKRRNDGDESVRQRAPGMAQGIP